MLKRFLRNLRQKPKPVRDQIALGAAGVFTAAVFVVWVYHFPNQISSQGAEAQKNLEASPGFSQFFSSFKEQFSAAKESFFEVVEEEPAVQLPVTEEASAAEPIFVPRNNTASSTVPETAPREIRIVTTKAPTTTAAASTTTGQ